MEDTFTIAVDNPTNCYFPGQVVSGLFQLDLQSTLEIKEIVIKFKGECHCEWVEGSGRNAPYHSDKESFFETEQVLFGKEQTNEDSFELPPGRLSYPFLFQIPANLDLPPSFDDQKNYVRYQLKADIKRPGSKTKPTKHVINLICPLDLNNIKSQDVTTTGEFKGEKTMCCYCCESDPVSVVVKTDRRGYVPGDKIVFNAEINNMSGRRMKYSKAQLIMKVKLTTGGNSREYTNKFDKIVHGSIEGGGSDYYSNERLVIPPVPPSYMPGSKLISIQYYVSVVVKPVGPAIRLRVNTEIVIGSIPLKSAAAELGLALPPLKGSSGVFDDTVLAKMPQASLQESVFGDSLKKKNKELKKGDVSTRFVPMYIYYKWNKDNPVDLFTTKQE